MPRLTDGKVGLEVLEGVIGNRPREFVDPKVVTGRRTLIAEAICWASLSSVLALLGPCSPRVRGRNSSS